MWPMGKQQIANILVPGNCRAKQTKMWTSGGNPYIFMGYFDPHGFRLILR